MHCFYNTAKLQHFATTLWINLVVTLLTFLKDVKTDAKYHKVFNKITVSKITESKKFTFCFLVQNIRMSEHS